MSVFRHPSSDERFGRSLVMNQLKSQKTDCSNPLWTLVRLKYGSGGLVSHCFYGAVDKPAIISQQNSSLGSAQDMLTSAHGLQRHNVLAEVSGHV